MTGGELGLLARTAVHLRPSQAVHRGRLRAQRAALRRWPRAGRALLTGPAQAAAGWPAGYRPLDAQMARSWPGAAQLAAGHVSLLGMTRDLGSPPDWQQADAPQLWRFHLHYWDWAWGLARDPDRAAARTVFARLWRSWRQACPLGSGDAWLPYPAALRAWSWCALYADLVAAGEADREFVAELATQAGFLRRHLETDVGGNHLIKNLKALTGLAVFFADTRLLGRTLRRLIAQLDVQVLADGGHYERAPAYHCQVLADLIDIAGLLQAAGSAPDPALAIAIARMRRWLGMVLLPDGQIPLLNDGYPVEPGLIAALRPPPPPPGPLLTLPVTGLARASVGGWELLADLGPPCPGELPAHAHADTLGCLVYVDGAPLLIDTGTSSYERGAVRDYERSTAAHNTVEVDGANSTEVWGAFRAGRRARVQQAVVRSDAGVVTVAAAHDGFRHLPGRPAHHRRWSLSGAGLEVSDLVTGRGRHTVAVHWHLVSGATLRLDGMTATVTTPTGMFGLTATADAGAVLTAEQRPVAAGFGRTTPAPVLTCRVTAQLPVRICTAWHRAGDRGPAAAAMERAAGAERGSGPAEMTTLVPARATAEPLS